MKKKKTVKKLKKKIAVLETENLSLQERDRKSVV